MKSIGAAPTWNHQFLPLTSNRLRLAACATTLPADKTQLTYDRMRRLLITNYPGTTADITRDYDQNGNLELVNRGGINWAYVYHPSVDLQTSATLTLDARTYAQTYGYNPQQVLTTYKLPSGKSVAHGVDGLGRVTGVTLDGASIASGLSYHPNGALSGMTYGNGQVFSQTQTARQMPDRLRSVKGSDVPVDLTYTYNPRGQIASINDQSPANIDQTFTYDGVGRLTAGTGPWGASTYSYDTIGNLLSRQVGARTVGLSYNAANNRLASHSDTAGAPPAPVTGTYAYDGHLRRVKQVVGGVTRYSVYDVSGGLVSINQVGTGPTEYIRASGMTLARAAGGDETR